jgi:hypothetical protein
MLLVLEFKASSDSCRRVVHVTHGTAWELMAILVVLLTAGKPHEGAAASLGDAINQHRSLLHCCPTFTWWVLVTFQVQGNVAVECCGLTSEMSGVFVGQSNCTAVQEWSLQFLRLCYS